MSRKTATRKLYESANRDIRAMHSGLYEPYVPPGILSDEYPREIFYCALRSYYLRDVEPRRWSSLWREKRFWFTRAMSFRANDVPF